MAVMFQENSTIAQPDMLGETNSFSVPDTLSSLVTLMYLNEDLC